MSSPNNPNSNEYDIYDHLIMLIGNPSVGLDRAVAAKQEFTTGDVIEQKGSQFMDSVAKLMNDNLLDFSKIIKINIDDKSIDEVFDDILRALHFQ
jgi:thymidylate kinase